MPYHIKPENSRHLNDIIGIIKKNRRSIEYPYHGRDDQIALLGKIRRHINAQIIETDESVNKNELVRYAIKKALDLDSRDVVVQLKRKYIVKLFKKNELLSSKAQESLPKSDEELRNPEELTGHYEELIQDIDLEEFLDNVMAELFATKLNFDVITNSYYEKNVFILIRHGIATELQQYVSENKEYIKDFAGYIFKTNFTKIHERIAIEILEKISIKSQVATKFLEYYSGTIYIEDAKKYSTPEISRVDGKRWNVPSIIAITNMWLRSKKQKAKFKVQLKNLLQRYNIIAVNFESMDEQKEKYEIELFEEENFDIEGHADIQMKQNNILESQATEYENLKMIQELSEEQNQNVLKNMKIEYLEMRKQKQYLEVEIKNLKNNLDINRASFHSIVASLVKALTQRKKLIED